MTNQDILQAIELFEIKNNGLKSLSGCSVIVRNLKVTKYTAIADVIIDSEGKSERYNDCQYSLDHLKSVKERYDKKNLRASL